MFMIILELFCGTKSISKAFNRKGHTAYTVDWDEQFKPDLKIDIGQMQAEDIIYLCGCVPDIIWASPDCSTYSPAGMFRHRKKDPISGMLTPISEYAKMCDRINAHLIDLIKEVNPKLWFIENPRGGMRKMPFMNGLPRYMVTYCQYGCANQKPTDIWTNHPNPNFKPPCRPRANRHVSAARGTTSGIQGMWSSPNRARIPDELCDYIVTISENYIRDVRG